MWIADSHQSREADRIMIQTRGVSGYALMETAGRKSAEYILRHYPDAHPITVLCGPGNNGGDGFVIARHLLRAGKEVEVIVSGLLENYSGDAALALAAWQEMKGECTLWQPGPLFVPKPNHLVVDALLGTGVNGPVRGNALSLLSNFRHRELKVVAIDLPSGLSADTGEVFTHPIVAEVTLTFHSPKVCHLVTPASEYCGKVVVVDIGIDADVLPLQQVKRRIIEPEEVRGLLPPLPTVSHKGTYGHAGFAGGSRSMAGAIALSTHAALSAGTGLSTAFLPGAARCAFYQHTWASMTFPTGDDAAAQLSENAIADFEKFLQGKNAIAIGPGMGQNEDTAAFLRGALPLVKVPLLLDADALNILAANDDLWELLPPHTVLTPHPGEMRRLTRRDEVNERRMELAEALAQERNVVVVLKGAHTLIAAPDGRTFVNLTGNPGMATAGAGDVLTGAITGLMAQGLSPVEAACAGVFLHGLAGDLAAEKTAGRGTTAQTILEHLSYTFQRLQELPPHHLTTV